MKYKSMIAPFIAVIAIALQLVFGIEINEDLQLEIATSIANLIAVGIVVYGIFKNHFAEEK